MIVAEAPPAGYIPGHTRAPNEAPPTREEAAVAATAPTRPSRESWRDWAPDAPEPAELLTREELLDRLAAEGLPVTGNQLRYWQTAGLVPYPIRRRLGQAVYAYYPAWMVELVRGLIDLRAQGHTLPQIRAILRAKAPYRASGESWNITVTVGTDFIEQRLAAIAEEIRTRLPHWRFTHVELRLSVDGERPLVWSTPIPPDDAC